MTKTVRRRFSRDPSGFTLIEILIVVILLGILATVIIPQISVSSEDAKLNTMKTNLSNMRSAIELYYYHHGNKYPAKDVPTTKPADVSDLADAFAAQMSRYTDVAGNISNEGGTSTYPLGPYIKDGLPRNPFNNSSEVAIDNTTKDITKREPESGNAEGWKFYSLTGILIANDGSGHESL